MVPFHNISVEEAQKALEGFKSANGVLLVFERTNSIMITDAAENANRIVEVLERMDTPVVAREEPFFRQIRYAKAEDVKARIEDLVAKMQEDGGGSKNNKSGTVAQILVTKGAVVETDSPLVVIA